MAISTLKRGAHLGNCEEVSLPYIATQDGFIHVYSHSTGSGAYDFIYVNTSLSKGIVNQRSSSDHMTGSTFVKKGDKVETSASNLIDSRTVYFMPLEVGG